MGSTERIDNENMRKRISFVREDGCFRCTSHTLFTSGYAKTQIDNKGITIPRLILLHRAHRNGIQIAKSVVTRHTCDNRWCIRPDHLLIGTQADNIRDMVERGRQSKGVNHWNAKLSLEQVKEAKRLIAKGVSCPVIASGFGVNKWRIHAIKQGKSWSEAMGANRDD